MLSHAGMMLGGGSGLPEITSLTHFAEVLGLSGGGQLHGELRGSEHRGWGYRENLCCDRRGREPDLYGVSGDQRRAHGAVGCP